MSSIKNERWALRSPFVLLTTAMNAVILTAVSVLGPVASMAGLSVVATLAICFAASSGLLIFIVLTSHIAELPGLNSELLYVVKWGVTLLLLGVLLARDSLGNREVDWKLSTIGKYFLVYSAWIAICSLFAYRPIDTLIEAVRVLGLFLVYEVARATISSERQARLIFLSVLIAVVMSCCYSMTDLLSGNYVRFSGFLTKANPYGTFLVFTIPVLVLGFCLSGNRMMRLLFGFATLAGTIALLLSWSRAAWFALLIEVIVFLILEKKKRFLAAIGLLILAGGIMLLSSPRIYAIADTVGRLSMGTTHRSIRWEKGIEAALTSPLVGHGVHYLNQDIVGKVSWGDYVEATVFHDRNASFDPHNVYVHTLLLGGIPLLAIFLAFCVHLFRSQYRQYRAAASKRERVLNSAMIAMIAGAMVNGFFERNLVLGMGATNNYFWIALGLVTTISEQRLLGQSKPNLGK